MQEDYSPMILDDDGVYQHCTDPIHQDSDGWWYFWDETWAYRHGPFNSLQECKEVLRQYCIEELGYLENITEG